MKTRTALALLALALSAAPLAADALGVEQAQQESLEHSPRYQRARAAAAERRWAKLEALSDFLPRVTLDATHFSAVKFQSLDLNFGGRPTTFDEIYPYSSLGFNATWTLFEGGAGLGRLHSEALGAQAADLEEGWALFQLRQDVRLKFYQALAAQKLAALADENVKTLEEHRRTVQDLMDNGQATRFDVLRVEVQLDEANTDTLAAQDKVVLARRRLAQAMGLDQDERSLGGDLPEPQPAPEGVPPLDEKPDVKARLLQARAAEAARLASAGHWAPRVTLLGGYQWYNNDHMDLGDTAEYRDAYQVGLAASWELFNGGGSLAREAQAGRRAEQAEQSAREARQQAGFDRDYWRRRLAYSTALYRAKLADVDKARESVRLATLGQKAGTRTTTEVLDAELDSFRAAAGVVSAQVDAAEALINLELALGKGTLP